MITATERMQAIADDGGVFVSAGLDSLLMEYADVPSMDTWMTVTSITQGDFQNLILPTGMRKTAIATPSYDCCSFNWSSSSEDGTVATKTLAGFDWVNVAQPISIDQPTQDGGPMRVFVNKKHTVGYEAGRSLTLLECSGETFIEVVGAGEDDETLVLPTGATLRTVALSKPLVIQLPFPTTTTYFWFHKGREIRSFQGPIDLPQEL